MQHRSSLISFAIVALLASPALASFGGGKSDPPPELKPPTTTDAISEDTSSGRKEAERAYASAYEEVGKAKKDLVDGKAKSAEKRFKHALEAGEHAVALEPGYYEAWNLVGYTARKLGNYDKAFAAYDKCLAIKVDYAPAREYLGEAWLERGDAKKAREQLVMLEKFNATEDVNTLRAAIESYEKSHPQDVAAGEKTSPPDSTSGK